MIRRFHVVTIFALLFFTFTHSQAQVTPSTETALGSSPYAVYNGGNVDSINPVSGNIFLHIPLLSYPQRGHALRLAFNIYYNDKRWYIENFQQNATTGQIQGSWTYYSGGTPTSNVGVYVARDQHVEFGEDISETQYSGGENYDPYLVTDITNGFWVREPDGAQHYYGDSASQSCSGYNCPITSSSYGITYPTSDGSGFLSNNSGSLTPTAITGRNGVIYSVSSTTSSSKNYETVTDKSGNSISASASGWTDTIGRTIQGSYASPGTSDGIDPSSGGEYGIDPIPGVPVAVPSQCSGANAARQWTVPEPNGYTQPYYLCYSNISFSTAFNIDATTGSTIYGQVTEASGTAPNLLTAIVLPNGTAYLFTYDKYLSLTKITLPTGGTISYVWQNLSVSGQTTGLGAIPVTRALMTRTVSPGSGEPSGTWTYHRYYNPNYGSKSASNPDFWTVVTDPNGNDVEQAVGGTDSNANLYYGQPVTASSVYTGCSSHDTASNRSCSGSGTLLQQHQYVLQTYGGITDGGGPWTVPDLYRQSTDTLTTPIASSTLTSQTSYTYVPNYGSCTTYSFNSTSTPVSDSHSSCFTTNQTASVANYNYGSAGSGSPGSLLNTTTTTYNWQLTGSYASANLLDLVKSTVITDGSGNRASETDYGYDGTGSPQGALGNQTSVTAWLNTGSSPTSTTTYNSQGMPTLTTDPRGKMSQLNYQCSGSLLTSTISPYNSSTTTSETTNYGYDCNSGYLTSLSDPNSVTTSYTYDALGRLLTTSVPNTSSATISFNGDPSPPHMTMTIVTGSSTPSIVTDTYYDGLGRPTQYKLTSDPSSQGAATSETTYDALGRVASVTNAHRSNSSPTDGTTQYTYDALGRKIIQTQQDSSVLSWCYNGLSIVSNQVCHGSSTGLSIDVTNELGATITQVYDGLARLKTVFEPGQNTSICYNGCRTVYVQGPETDYTYDALNNLLSVTQQGAQSSSSLYRVRTFSYDSLSRLLASNNPEKASAQNPAQLSCPLASTGPWTECFAYDLGNNLTKHTDNRNISTMLSYDILGRLISKSYTDTTPTATFTYDVGSFSFVSETNPAEKAGSQTNLIGRLAVESTAGNTTLTQNGFSYDALGRIIIKSTCVPRTCSGNTYTGGITDQYDMHYSYDEAGNMTYAGNGLLSRTDAASPNSGYYYSGLNLSYQGSPQVLSAHSDLPVDSTHPTQDIATSITYTPLGDVSSATAGDELAQTFTYSPRDWLMTINSTDFNGNQKLIDTSSRDSHGNVLSATDSLQGQYDFCYGPVNQLYQVIGPISGTAPACNTANGTTYSYDNFGNLLGRTVYSGSGYQFSFVPNVHNQDPSRNYDAAGNLLADGVHTYTYDAESRISMVDGSTQYFYDAEGRRVSEGNVGQTPTTDFLYNLQGGLVTTVGTNFKMIRSSLYAAGRHWSDYTTGTGSGGGNTEYRVPNGVGSLYFNLDQTGSPFEECQQGVFGESLSCNPSVDFTETHFVDQKRDQESNLDYMGARYYSSTLGRFMSPDPSGLYYADLTNPQSLNLYSYAQNNPLKNTDPTGLDCVYFNNAGSGVESVDHNSNSGECGNNGGDWVNGYTDASQVQYNANSDTFNIRSSDSWHNYNSTAYAPGPGGGGNGIPCSGNCDTATGYSSSLKLTDWIGYQGGYVSWLVSAKLNQANTAANNLVNSRAAMYFACFADPGDVMAIQDLQRNHRADPSDPADPLVGGGASAIYMNNNQATRNGGQNNILGNQEPGAAAMGGAGLIGQQIVQGGVCAGQQ